jgi:hypothetical protein
MSRCSAPAGARVDLRPVLRRSWRKIKKMCDLADRAHRFIALADT